MTIGYQLGQYERFLAATRGNAALISEIKSINQKAGQELVSLPKRDLVVALLLAEFGGAASVREYLAGAPLIERLWLKPPAGLEAAREQAARIEDEITVLGQPRPISFLDQPTIVLGPGEVAKLEVPALTLADGRLVTVRTVVLERMFSGTDIPALQQAVEDWPREVAFQSIVKERDIEQRGAPLFLNELEDRLAVTRDKQFFSSIAGELFVFRAPALAIVMVPNPEMQRPAPALAVVGRWFRREADAEKSLAATKLRVGRLLRLRDRGNFDLVRMLQAFQKTAELHLSLVMLCCPDQRLTEQERLLVEELISQCPNNSIDLALVTYWHEAAEQLLKAINGNSPAEPWDAAEGERLSERACREFVTLLKVDPEHEPQFEQIRADLHAALDHLCHKQLGEARAKLRAVLGPIAMTYKDPTPAETFAFQVARAMGVNYGICR